MLGRVDVLTEHPFELLLTNPVRCSGSNDTALKSIVDGAGSRRRLEVVEHDRCEKALGVVVVVDRGKAPDGIVGFCDDVVLADNDNALRVRSCGEPGGWSASHRLALRSGTGDAQVGVLKQGLKACGLPPEHMPIFWPLTSPVRGQGYYHCSLIFCF